MTTKTKIAVMCASCGILASAFAAKVEYIELFSESMQTNVPGSVILPDAYEADANVRFPVVYALHGAGGESRGFFQARPGGILPRLSDKYGFIAVCPDGAKTSWWLDSPVNPKMKYETLVVKEVLPYIDAKYLTLADRTRRAIFGVSMGGHGACYIGFRHTDLFGAVGNIVGGVNLTPYPHQWGLDKVLGDPEKCPENWRDFSALSQAKNLGNGDVELISICGTGDFFLLPNRAMHDMLSQNNVRHTYIEMRGKNKELSTHTIAFAREVMPLVALFFDNYFRTGEASL